MKIAIVCDRVYPYFKGGVEKRYWDIARKLIDNGHEVNYYTGQWPGMKKEVIIDGINLHGVYTVKNFYFNGKKSIKESIIYSFKLFPYLLKADFDVIECDQFPLLHIFPAKLASIVKRKPLIVTWHEVWGLHWFKYLGLKGIIGYLTEQIVVLLPNTVISISKSTTKHLIEKTKIKKNKIIEIPNGVNIDYIAKIQPSTVKNDIIFVGRLLNHKHVDILIKAIEIVRNKIPGVRCLIIGDGPEIKKLKILKHKLGVQNSIKIIGNLDNHKAVISLIKSSKVLVLPSTREGFGMVTVEAMACGIPTITIMDKNNAAMRLIVHGKNGFISKLDEKDLAEAISKVISNGLNNKMRQGCINTAKQYDLKEVIKKIEAIYTTKTSSKLATII